VVPSLSLHGNQFYSERIALREMRRRYKMLMVQHAKSNISITLICVAESKAGYGTVHNVVHKITNGIFQVY
jgi:hypothetical protein